MAWRDARYDLSITDKALLAHFLRNGDWLTDFHLVFKRGQFFRAIA